MTGLAARGLRFEVAAVECRQDAIHGDGRGASRGGSGAGVIVPSAILADAGVAAIIAAMCRAGAGAGRERPCVCPARCL